jgi:hypothetical protein
VAKLLRLNAKCRSCGAPIIWAKTKNDKTIPLDATPTADGNLLLVDGVARAPEVTDDVPFLQYKSHFATCPDAESFRRKKARK